MIGSKPSKLKQLRAWFDQALRFAEEIYSVRYRSTIARARRDEDDLFMLLVFAELMGVPSPAGYYTLELQPLLLERFHDWHRRMGMERSPLDGFRCC
ncbi:MAG TPA: cory-CC-star protein [Gammaproteobacteria bacterium]|nr:cory-CC-star protein [Gammaproteobacteria bacterium]